MFTSLITARKGSSRERGQGLIEYALILILIAIAVVAIVGALGQTVNDKMYADISCSMDAAIDGTPVTDC